jgi:radical SAM protein with 4Fe4S-binding SPASM domain
MSAGFTRPFPRVVRIEPASACNLACSHCPTGTVDMARGVMKPEVFDAVLKRLQPHAGSIKVAVLYHGGEPLLNRRFPEMVKAVKDLGIPFVKTVSNGMLLTAELARKLLDSGLDAIEFSLDGTDPAENDFIRRNARFNVVVDNVKRLMDEKAARGASSPRVHISTTQFVDPRTYRPGQEAPVPGHLTRAFGGTYAAGLEGFKACFAMRWPHMGLEEGLYDVFEDARDPDRLDHCDHVESTMTIRWNGDVVPCCYDLTSRAVLGNVLTEEAEGLWNNARYQGFREGIKNRDYPSLCENCNVVRRPVYLVLKESARKGVPR